MPATQRVLTLHAETGLDVQFALLDAVEGVLNGQGVSRIWIERGAGRDLVVLAEVED